jgi:5'-nucleotidase
MNNRPLIFITNDDGYQSAGMAALIDAVKNLGTIVVVAPDSPRSGASSAITSHIPLRTELQHEAQDLKIYSCNGTPVDCVKLGLWHIVPRRPDITLTGINHGANSSICVLYSGTMGAAMESCVFKIPSIGFSLSDYKQSANFEHTKPLIRNLTREVLKTGLPTGVCLNVNFPCGEVKGAKICRQAAGQWVDEFVQATDGFGRPIYWMTGRFANDEPEDNSTDEWALENHYASIVPTKVDMTAHQLLPEMKIWEKLPCK